LLLRARGERPRGRRAPKNSNEIASPHCAPEKNASANARNLALCERMASKKWRPTYLRTLTGLMSASGPKPEKLKASICFPLCP
jgi:hypothetical protein